MKITRNMDARKEAMNALSVINKQLDGEVQKVFDEALADDRSFDEAMAYLYKRYNDNSSWLSGPNIKAKITNEAMVGLAIYSEIAYQQEKMLQGTDVIDLSFVYKELMDNSLAYAKEIGPNVRVQENKRALRKAADQKYKPDTETKKAVAEALQDKNANMDAGYLYQQLEETKNISSLKKEISTEDKIDFLTSRKTGSSEKRVLSCYGQSITYDAYSVDEYLDAAIGVLTKVEENKTTAKKLADTMKTTSWENNDVPIVQVAFHDLFGDRDATGKIDEKVFGEVKTGRVICSTDLGLSATRAKVVEILGKADDATTPSLSYRFAEDADARQEIFKKIRDARENAPKKQKEAYTIAISILSRAEQVEEARKKGELSLPSFTLEQYLAFKNGTPMPKAGINQDIDDEALIKIVAEQRSIVARAKGFDDADAPAVLAAQNTLVKLNEAAGETLYDLGTYGDGKGRDGKLGPKTKLAIKKFQEEHGIYARDNGPGDLDFMTIAALQVADLQVMANTKADKLDTVKFKKEMLEVEKLKDNLSKASQQELAKIKGDIEKKFPAAKADIDHAFTNVALVLKKNGINLT